MNTPRPWQPLATFVLLGAIATLAGCAAKSSKPGDEIRVTCHGQEWAQCFRKADQRCGAKQYQLLSQITDEGSSANDTNNSLIRGTFVQRTLVARCTDGRKE